MAKSPFTEILVQNLSEEYKSDHKLEELFATFGDITYAKVRNDRNGKSKDFGYVSFAEPSVALKAMKILNGMSVKGGKALHITPVVTKEEK